jgi:hypothetical protein
MAQDQDGIGRVGRPGDPGKEAASYRGIQKHYALSRSGFTKQLERQAFEDGVALFAGPELRREPARSEPTCGGASSSTAVEGDENAFLMDKAGKWSYHRPST